ncbi:MAG: YiaA/YiaB family inner membrane protein [Granulosicoccaceae bacterium]
MNAEQSTSHSSGWILFVRAAFVLSLVGMGLGILNIEADFMTRCYLGLASVFIISSTFTLAKTVRDVHEESRLQNKISEAKTNKILQEYAE